MEEGRKKSSSSDARPSLAGSKSRASPSKRFSLRNLLEENPGVLPGDESGGGGGGGRDEFTITDAAHQQQEFGDFMQGLASFSLLDQSLVDEILEDTHQANVQKAKKNSSMLSMQSIPVGDLQVKGDKDASSIYPVTGVITSSTSSVSSKRDSSRLNAYQTGAKESLESVLDQIDAIQLQQREKGMGNSNYTFGLMNCLLLAYLFGAHPEHFWIAYLSCTVFWMIRKFRGMRKAKPLSEIYYYFDFCWIMNMFGVVLLTAIVIGGKYLSQSIRQNVFMGVYGIAAGPVFLAAMALPFVAFLFHDTNTMANLVIHVTPCMQLYTMRWHFQELHKAWPDVFDLEYFNAAENIPFWNGWAQHSVARNAILIYLVWWVCYMTWMIPGGGLKLPVTSKDPNAPTPKYDTVFHSLWRGGPCELVGTLLWKRAKTVSRDQSLRNDFELRDFLFYMTGHAIACIFIGILGVANLCYRAKWMHAVLLLLATTICGDRGAHRYTYYVTAMYGQKLRQHFASLDEPSKSFVAEEVVQEMADDDSKKDK